MKKNLLFLLITIFANLMTFTLTQAASSMLYIQNDRVESVILLLISSLNITRKTATTSYSDWPSESTTYIHATSNCNAPFNMPKELEARVPDEFKVGLVYAQEIPQKSKTNITVPCDSAELINIMVMGVKVNNTYLWFYKHTPIVKSGTNALISIDSTWNGFKRMTDATRELFRQAQQALSMMGAQSVFAPQDNDERVTKQTQVLNDLQMMFQK